MKIGFVFAGQGAQFIGMGKDFYDTYPESKVCFDQASASLGYDMAQLCFEGPEEKLNQTEFTQPAILTTSIAMLSAFNHLIDLKPQGVAGLSLGEYSAHVCAGSIAYKDALPLVRQRGAAMQKAVPVGQGGMTALIGIAPDKVEHICQEASTLGIVEVANYNSPKQIVIGGDIKAVEKAGQLAKEAGAKRVIPLTVSAPFHTSMLKQAELDLEEILKTIPIGQMSCPVFTNVTGQLVAETSDIKPLLSSQVTHAVRWIDCIHSMEADGIDTIIAFGPGTALKGFIGKINRSLKVYAINTVEDLTETLAKINM